MEMKDKIKMLREQHGLTLEEVGKVVGVGKSTVRKWETGDIANMRRDKIAKLAEALHTTPAFLMGWEIDPDAGSIFEKVANQVSLDILSREYDARNAITPSYGGETGMVPLAASLSDQEIAFITAYRRADDRTRQVVNLTLEPFMDKPETKIG